MPGKVLDSFALLAYFRDEPGAEAVEALLVAAGVLVLGAVAAFRVPRVLGPGATIVARVSGTGAPGGGR